MSPAYQGFREGSLIDLNQCELVHRRMYGRTQEKELQDQGPEAQDALEGQEARFFHVSVLW